MTTFKDGIRQLLTQKANLILLAAIILGGFSFYAPGTAELFLVFCSVEYVVVNYNIFQGKDKLSTVLRRSLNTLPFLAPIIFMKNGSFDFLIQNNFLESIGWGLVITVPYLSSLIYKNWELIRSEELILIFGSNEKTWFRISLYIYTTMAAAVCEEIFFRQTVHLMLGSAPLWIYIMISASLFVLSHALTLGADRISREDYIFQIVVSILACLVYYKTENILGCILLHLSHNSINIYITIRKFFIMQTNPNAK